jgi:hypothetical protein
MIGHMSVSLFRGVLLGLALAFSAGEMWSENADAVLPAPMSSAQIVEQMRQHNRVRTDALKHYVALRHYVVEYSGFPAKAGASMDVEVTYDAASGKSFRIVSQSGTKFLRDKVLKRAVDSEKEASLDKQATALTEANYRFESAGSEILAGRPAYVLNVEPLTKNKFLYRGKIWVDAADFALVKVDAEPAKNPSFWITRTRIQFTNAYMGGFWLQELSRSETKVRIGGNAVLIIDYGKYQTVPQVLQTVD